jgi:hypothetical protein
MPAAVNYAVLHQGQSPIPSLNLHCSIALKSVVPIPHSLDLFLVPFGSIDSICIVPHNSRVIIANYFSFLWSSSQIGMLPYF